MFELFYILVIFLLSFSLGKKLFSFFNWKWDSFAEELAFSLAIGFATIAYFIFALGLLGLLYKQIFLAMLVVIAIVTWKEIFYLFSTVRKTKISLKANFYTLLLLFLLLLAFLNLIGAMAPAYSYDALGYQLAVPKLWLSEHQIFSVPHIFFSNWPFLTNMLFMLGLGIQNDVLANLIAYLIGITTVISVYAFTSQILNKKTGIIASTIFYSTPMVILYATSALIDISTTLFAVLGLFAFYLWIEKKEMRWLALSAVVLGLSASTKMIGLINIFIVGLLVLYASRNNQLVKHAAIFGLISILVASPFYINNYVNTGNPVYPLFYNYFGGTHWSSYEQDKWNDIAAQSYPYSGFSNFLLLPWNLTMHSSQISRLLGIGPLFLAFIPLYIFLKKKQSINYLLAFLLLFSILWYVVVPSVNIRHFMVGVALLSIVAAYSIKETMKTPVKYVTAAVIVTFLLFGFVLWYGTTSKNVPVALGLESEGEFYDKLIDKNPYRACQHLNDNFPDSKTLLFSESRGFFCDTEYVWGQPGVQGYVAYGTMETYEDLYLRLSEIGITHVMLNPGLLPKISLNEKEFNLMDGLLAKYGEKVYEDKSIILYKLLDKQ
ncbi:hypothetical protein CMO88_00885 [Candidatus Woesearchaeota archaeon]|nr:hypothetical protein [Candidatus Woesearchaeota archaeon]|tara:strand:- start:16501 stop:18312 length:1812 start_codon:yes stop_codon:yes gene_type:complete